MLGLLLATQEALKHFGAEGGSVINVSSIATSVTPPNTSIYTGTKGAVDAITRVLAKELGPKKVRVNAIRPGGVVTEGFHAMGGPGSDFEKQMIAQTPLGRIGQPVRYRTRRGLSRFPGRRMDHRRNDYGRRRPALTRKGPSIQH